MSAYGYYVVGYTPNEYGSACVLYSTNSEGLALEYLQKCNDKTGFLKFEIVNDLESIQYL